MHAAAAARAQCNQLMNRAYSDTNGLNGYDIYRDCYNPQAGKAPFDPRAIRADPTLLRNVIRAPRPAHPAVKENVPCIDRQGRAPCAAGVSNWRR